MADLKPELWPENYWITDQQIDDVWGNANFGGRDRREVIREALAQTAADYSTGHTSLCICRELRLVCGAVGKPKLTALGRKYLYYANKFRTVSAPVQGVPDTVKVIEMPNMIGAYLISAPLKFVPGLDGQMMLLNPENVVRLDSPTPASLDDGGNS